MIEYRYATVFKEWEEKKVWFDALTYGQSARVGGGGKQDGDNLSGKSKSENWTDILIDPSETFISPRTDSQKGNKT